MTLTNLKGVLLALGLCASAPSFAYDFTAADTAYFARGSATAANRTVIAEAVKAYEAAVASGLGKEEQIYAVEQMARLYTFESFLGLDSASIKAVGDKCLAAIEKINPSTSTVGENPHYYYWHAVCRMFWAKANGPLSSLSYAQAVIDLIETGEAIEPSYEGGGFERLTGIMFANLPAFNPTFGPVKDMPRALKAYADSVNSDEAYEDAIEIAWKDPTTETGAYFYNTHYYWAKALNDDGQGEAAKALAKKAIADIDAGKASKSRAPETQVAKRQLQELLASFK
jgi:hypothetical protein